MTARLKKRLVSMKNNLKPPFFKALQKYIDEGNSRLATPGHHMVGNIFVPIRLVVCCMNITEPIFLKVIFLLLMCGNGGSVDS